MSVGLYSGTSGLALGVGLWSGVPGFWSGAAGLIDGLGAALDLNFLAGAPLDSRITFSRGTQATLTDSTGKITYAPNNLLTNSESFESASWGKFAANISSNVTAAPDGTTTADKAIATAVAGYHGVSFNIAPGPLTHIFSIYVKASEYSRFRISDGASARFAASFTLTGDGVVSDTSGANFVAAGITPVGNGWYRCFVRVTNISGSAAFQFMGYPAGATLDGYGVQYTGDGTSGIFIWGAQLEQVTYQTTPGTYNSTTPKNLLGYTQEFDNAAWTKSNSFVQTNLALTSTFSTLAGSAGSQYPSGTGWSNFFSTGGTRTFVASSVLAGSQAMDIASVSAARNVIGFSFTPSASTTYTVSFYVESVSGATGIVAYATGTLGTGGTTNNITAPTTTGRYSYTFTTGTASGTVDLRFGIGCATNESGSIRISNVQVVQGATAGDYQPTYAAAAAVQYAAPDGTLSADKLVPSDGVADGNAQQVISNTSASVAYTFSCYIKSATLTTARLRLTARTAANAFISEMRVDANLSAGTVGAVTAGTFTSTSASIADAGNGWYRISISGIAPATTAILWPSVRYTPTGDGTSGIYVWGAQLSNSASLDPYVYNPGAAPTSAAYYGPRFDYDPVTLAPKGLLIEEQRSNLVTYSAQFDNASWTKTNATVTANAVASPDGTVDADKLVENTTPTAIHAVASASATLAATTAYTATIYAKKAERNWVNFQFSTVPFGTTTRCWFDLDNGVMGTATNCTGSITPVGGGWYRCAVTATTTVGGNGSATLYLSTGNNITSYTGDGTSGIYLYGAQLEAGAFATSYIPTVASTVTRSADVAQMLGTNFASWYNQNEGTFVTGADTADASTANRSIYFASNAGSTEIVYGVAGATRTLRVLAGGVETASIGAGAFSNNTPAKTAGAYKVNDFAASFNGGAVGVDTSGAVPAGIDRLTIGTNTALSAANYLNGHIRAIQYYNTRLPNDQLQAISA